MELNFRKLRADEIEVRVGGMNKAKTGAFLLLYKDARCDMNVLDDEVGAMNWQREHSNNNANCTVSIYNKDIKQWVSKEDTGAGGNTSSEHLQKGLASDSFKRACFNWGIGRELYTAPFIWINGNEKDLKFLKAKVTHIDYDKYGNINALAISDDKGKQLFKMGNSRPAHNNKKQKEPSKTKQVKKQKPTVAQAKELAKLLGNDRVAKMLQHYGVEAIVDIDKKTVEQLIKRESNNDK